MPASSISFMGSWGVYILASCALLIALGPTLRDISASSYSTEARQTLDGLTQLTDALSPGVSVRFAFSSIHPGDSISFEGHAIAYKGDSFEFRSVSEWLLQQTSIQPGSLYVLGIANGTVHVTNLGRD